MMQEAVADVLAGRGNLIGHVHVADAPGRHEPGNGTIDWAASMLEIRKAGYGGIIGLEFRPTARTTEALRVTREHLFR
jgi:hydroxypyruvate isomerase